VTSSKLSGGAIAGIIIGISLVAWVTVLILFFFLRRRYARRRSALAESDEQQNGRSDDSRRGAELSPAAHRQDEKELDSIPLGSTSHGHSHTDNTSSEIHDSTLRTGSSSYVPSTNQMSERQSTTLTYITVPSPVIHERNTSHLDHSTISSSPGTGLSVLHEDMTATQKGIEANFLDLESHPYEGDNGQSSFNPVHEPPPHYTE